MNAINGTFKNGQIVPDEATDWPDGCRLKIEPVPTEPLPAPTNGEEPETPQEIDSWLRWYHALEPLEFTPEEEADLAAWRQRMKKYDIAHSQQRIEELFP